MIRRPRINKVLADLWGNPTRSLLVIASITVGLVALGIIANMYAVMSEDMRAGFAAANPANIQIQGGLFHEDILAHVKNQPNVGIVEGAHLFSARLQAEPEDWIEFSLRSVDHQDESTLNQVRLVEGAWPPGDREIVIEAYKFADTNAQIGELVTIELSDGTQRELRVVGIVNDQTLGAFDTGPGFFVAPAQGYVTPETAEWLGQPAPGNFNTLYATVDGDRGDTRLIKQVGDEIRQELEDDGIPVFSLITRSAYDHPNRVYVDALIGVLLLLGLMVVFLSGFLITNTLQALMKQQVQQIGIMKSLGARRRQIIIIYLGLIIIFGIVAAAISVPLSARVAFSRIDSVAGEINFIFQGPRSIPWVIGLQIGLAILVPLFAGLFPIIRGSQISVQRALSGLTQNAPEQAGKLSRALTNMRRLPRPLIISIRNTFRQKARMILTLITLSLGGAIFIASFNVQVSMNQYVEKVSRYFLADVNLSLSRPYRVTRVQEALSTVDGIKEIEGWTVAQAELLDEDKNASDSAQILAPPAGSQLVQPILIEGRWIQPGDRNAIAVNEKFLNKYPDLKPGDPIVVRVNSKDEEWVVVGIFQLVGNSAGYLIYANHDYVSELIGQPNQTSVYRVVANTKGLSEDQQLIFGQEIEQTLKSNGIDVREMTPGKSLSTLASDGFSILTAFLLFLSGLTALVGSIGLAGTMSMNVMERTREIGVMRAIGATNSVLMRMVIIEGMLIGMISWIIGSLLAFPISKALADAISLSIFGAPSTFGVTPTGFIIWLFAVFILSTIASAVPARHASRLTIREVLAYE